MYYKKIGAIILDIKKQCYFVIFKKKQDTHLSKSVTFMNLINTNNLPNNNTIIKIINFIP